MKYKGSVVSHKCVNSKDLSASNTDNGLQRFPRNLEGQSVNTYF